MTDDRHEPFRRQPATSAPAPSRPVPVEGRLAVRVRYCECDPMGVAHHAAYLPWLEMARTELLREAGATYAQLEAAGCFLVIVKVEASYKAPAYYDDLIEVRTRVTGGSRIKIRHEYEVVRLEAARAGPGTITPGRPPAPGDVILTAQTLLACVDRTGRPAALPDWLAPASA